MSSNRRRRKKRWRSKMPVTEEVAMEVWAAEDGRCEACGRPMDRYCTRLARLDDSRRDFTADNLQLLCIDCKDCRPDLLEHLAVASAPAKEVAARLGVSVKEAAQWLGKNMRRYGVIVAIAKRGSIRHYWLPGVGTFRVLARPGKPTLIEKSTWLNKEANLKAKPQERTRGLPPPDRSRKEKAAAQSGPCWLGGGWMSLG